jgi:hypothetical protein
MRPTKRPAPDAAPLRRRADAFSLRAPSRSLGVLMSSRAIAREPVLGRLHAIAYMPRFPALLGSEWQPRHRRNALFRCREKAATAGLR